MQSESKGNIRQQMRRRRRQLSGQAQRLAASALCNRLFEGPLRRRFQCIAGYFPVDGEISILPVLSRLMWQGKSVYLPVLPPRVTDRELAFYGYYRDSNLVSNRWGIPEPLDGPICPVRALDVVLLPLTAFDPAGRRIGMGGGYYDCTFAFRRYRNQWRRPYLVGIAHEVQKIPHIEQAHWDVPVDCIVTDRAIYPVTADTKL